MSCTNVRHTGRHTLIIRSRYEIQQKHFGICRFWRQIFSIIFRIVIFSTVFWQWFFDIMIEVFRHKCNHGMFGWDIVTIQLYITIQLNLILYFISHRAIQFLLFIKLSMSSINCTGRKEWIQSIWLLVSQSLVTYSNPMWDGPCIVMQAVYSYVRQTMLR